MQSDIQSQPTFRTLEHPFRYSFTTCFKERIVANFLDLKNNDKVLEMGCGSAYFFSVLKRYFSKIKFFYSGIDMEKDAVQAAQFFCGPEASISNGDVSALHFQNGQFDKILYLDVIEHVKDDQKSLNEAFRVLKPNGSLIVSTPNSSALLTDTFFCEYLHDHGHMANQRHGYTEKELSLLLKNAGFEVERIGYSNTFLSEILITITKLGYRLKREKYNSQKDVFEVENSLLFLVHKYLFFPFGYVVGRIEELLLGWLLKGHCMIILAKKP